jgi:hypothetical protein
MSVKILSDKLDSVNLYDKDGNLISRLNGVTDVCVGHTPTDEESRIIDYFNSVPCQSFTISFKKLPLWTRIKIKLHLLYMRIIGGYKYWRYTK